MMLQNVHKEFKVPYFGYFIHNVYEHTILTLTRYRKSVNTRKYRFGLYLLFLETCLFFLQNCQKSVIEYLQHYQYSTYIAHYSVKRACHCNWFIGMR